jgi:PadR family transcriptional regulator
LRATRCLAENCYVCRIRCMPSLTAATALVLESLARGYWHAFDILDATGLPSGTVYPILRPLASARLSRVTMGERRHLARAAPPRNHEFTAVGLALAEPARSRNPASGDLPARARVRRA